MQIPALHFGWHFGENETSVGVFQFIVGRHVSRVSEFSDEDQSVRTNGQPGDAAVVEGHPKPRFRWQLKSPTHEIPDHVGVSHEHFVRIALLRGFGTMDTILYVVLAVAIGQMIAEYSITR